ncbi:MAG: enoyl-CoA hydratase/isomerase family protein [Candidatus Korobacteraceae bacterium]|jgi:cyclohexa-1,5-dienecarbonyl-CoA hydratase
MPPITQEEKKLTVEITGSVARISLNNPPLNMIDLEMMGALREHLIALEQKPNITAIVFAGNERVFSAGMEVAVLAPQTVETTLNKFHAAVRALVATSKLTIASVRRHCLGGGAELALVCDIVYAGSDAIFGFPEIKLAAFPPVAMVALSAIVGQKRAAELLFTARSLTAQEALAMGLVNQIADDPETLVAECLQRVSQLSPAALRIAKKAFYGWESMHFEKGLMRAEEIYREYVTRSEDGKEGIRAFIEKRRPVWTGK